jgi:hypothetical protein
LLASGLICWWNISAYGNSSSSTSSWILRLLRRSGCWLDETAVGSSACFVQCLAAKKARFFLLKPPPRAPEEIYRRLIAALIGWQDDVAQRLTIAGTIFTSSFAG